MANLTILLVDKQAIPVIIVQIMQVRNLMRAVSCPVVFFVPACSCIRAKES